MAKHRLGEAVLRPLPADVDVRVCGLDDEVVAAGVNGAKVNELRSVSMFSSRSSSPPASGLASRMGSGQSRNFFEKGPGSRASAVMPTAAMRQRTRGKTPSEGLARRGRHTIVDDPCRGAHGPTGRVRTGPPFLGLGEWEVEGGPSRFGATHFDSPRTRLMARFPCSPWSASGGGSDPTHPGGICRWNPSRLVGGPLSNPPANPRQSLKSPEGGGMGVSPRTLIDPLPRHFSGAKMRPQSCFMSTTVQPRAGASSRAWERRPTGESRS